MAADKVLHLGQHNGQIAHILNFHLARQHIGQLQGSRAGPARREEGPAYPLMPVFSWMILSLYPLSHASRASSPKGGAIGMSGRSFPHPSASSPCSHWQQHLTFPKPPTGALSEPMQRCLVGKRVLSLSTLSAEMPSRFTYWRLIQRHLLLLRRTQRAVPGSHGRSYCTHH